METRAYPAILFKQRTDSPLQVAFAAPSCEVDGWARVPTKKTGNVRNFQRAQIPKHIQEVERFFENQENASPTAVVVGFDAVRSKGQITTRGPNGEDISGVAVSPGEPVLGTIEIRWNADRDPKTDSEVLAEVLRLAKPLKEVVYQDLKDIASVQGKVLDSLLGDLVERILAGKAPTEEESPTDVTVENGSFEPTLDIEVPESFKAALPGLSPSEQQVVLGRLLFLANTDEAVASKLGAQGLQALYREVRDELKPAILIDGQHRIAGTRKMGRIPFLVTALPTATWPELAFQFIVTNRTARRVPESLLISIVGNSLSKGQRADIEARLRDANIRVGLIEAVMRVQEDDLSPFFGMIAFGLKGEEGFLDAAAMRGKVIQLWYERQPPVGPMFDHVCQGKRRADRVEYWKDEELWFEYFAAFWNAVRERYEGTGVFSRELVAEKGKWVPASKLMTATVLMIFQETVLDYMLAYLNNKNLTEGVPVASSLPDSDRFYKLVKNTLSKLTPDFFTEWQLSGFDGSKGARDDLSDAIKKVITSDATVAQLKKKPHRLFKSEN